MIRAEDDGIRVDGEHLAALYTHLRGHEETLSPQLAEIHTAVQRLLYDTLSIDELERLNSDPEDQ